MLKKVLPFFHFFNELVGVDEDGSRKSDGIVLGRGLVDDLQAAVVAGPEVPPGQSAIANKLRRRHCRCRRRHLF